MKPRPKKTPRTTPAKPVAIANRRDQILADFTTLRIPVTAEQLDTALQHAQDAGLSHLDFLHRLLADQAGLRRVVRRGGCMTFIASIATLSPRESHDRP